jgi:methyl-accepting chemotaxis protein
MMEAVLRMHGGWRLKTKILGVASSFLTGVVLLFLAAGYAFVREESTLDEAIGRVSERVASTTRAQTAIIEMDRAIQALIAADDPDPIRAAAVESIRAGATVDEAVKALGDSFGKDASVDRLIALMSDLRPRQMQVIVLARANDDAHALELAAQIKPSFEEIRTLVQKLVDASQSALREEMDKVKQRVYATVRMLALFGLGGVVLGIFLALNGSQKVSRPMVEIERVMRSVSAGNLTADIDVSRASRDEIGQTTLAIHETVMRLRELLGRINQATSKVSDEAGAVIHSAADVERGSQVLDHSVSHIREETDKLKDATHAASMRLDGAVSVAGAASATAVESAQRIAKSVDDFQHFRQMMEATATQSQALSGVAQKIHTITNSIRDISEQTNLLALNAAIEAARAGEQGRGFAVVADEVRALAGRSSQAVAEISALVAGIGPSVAGTVEAIGKALARATDNIGQLQDAAHRTSATSQSIQSASDAMREVVSLMQSQQAAAAAIASASEQLAGISGQYRSQSQDLRARSGNLEAAAGQLHGAVVQFRT